MSKTFIGKVYLRFDELPSTNDYAAELLAADGQAKSKPEHGTVIRTDKQSAGRGQFGSRWEVEPGRNLTLSVILYPDWLPADRQFYLGMTVALALCDLLDPQLPDADVRIKWPNDIYVGREKIAGILIQNSLLNNHIQSSIVGIGLNVNQLHFPDALFNPTSMALRAGWPFDLEAVADSLLECLEQRYLALEGGALDELKAEYESRLFRRNEAASYLRTATDGIFSATLRGVTPDGLLRLETEGKEETFDLKEVRFVL